MATATIRESGVLVEATDVCVHYGATVALAPTSFSLGRGSAVALVGSNGSGKTTLLSTVAGLVQPSSGSVAVTGTVSMVTQSPHHHRWMPLTVDEVLRMGRYSSRRPGRPPAGIRSRDPVAGRRAARGAAPPQAAVR